MELRTPHPTTHPPHAKRKNLPARHTTPCCNRSNANRSDNSSNTPTRTPRAPAQRPLNSTKLAVTPNDARLATPPLAWRSHNAALRQRAAPWTPACHRSLLQPLSVSSTITMYHNTDILFSLSPIYLNYSIYLSLFICRALRARAAWQLVAETASGDVPTGAWWQSLSIPARVAKRFAIFGFRGSLPRS